MHPRRANVNVWTAAIPRSPRQSEHLDFRPPSSCGLTTRVPNRFLVRDLTGNGVRVTFLKEGLSFTGDDSPMATLLLSVMGAFAEFERVLIRERQREGIALAKTRGVYAGRKPSLSPSQAIQLRNH